MKSTIALEGTATCGKCGVGIPLDHADIAADGYRCLSCSTDEKIAASAADARREATRMGALKLLRLPLLGGLCSGMLTTVLDGTGRWIAALVLAACCVLGAALLRTLIK